MKQETNTSRPPQRKSWGRLSNNRKIYDNPESKYTPEPTVGWRHCSLYALCQFQRFWSNEGHRDMLYGTGTLLLLRFDEELKKSWRKDKSQPQWPMQCSLVSSPKTEGRFCSQSLASQPLLGWRAWWISKRSGWFVWVCRSCNSLSAFAWERPLLQVYFQRQDMFQAGRAIIFSAGETRNFNMWHLPLLTGS